MDGNDTPAVLESPLDGVSAEPSDVIKPEAPSIGAADLVAAQAGADRAMKAIRAQPTEKIRVPKIHGPQVVIINGARFNVPANVYVNVPQQVAEILRDAGRI